MAPTFKSRRAMKCIENTSRSDVNEQSLTFYVDFKTSFKVIMFLRSELEGFLKENHRDYRSTLGLTGVSLQDLHRLGSVRRKKKWKRRWRRQMEASGLRAEKARAEVEAEAEEEEAAWEGLMMALVVEEPAIHDGEKIRWYRRCCSYRGTG